MKKPSEIFEGENSSLRKTYDKAIDTEKLREEWKNYCYSQDPRRILTQKEIASWWLSKLLQRERDILGEIEMWARENRKDVKGRKVHILGQFSRSAVRRMTVKGENYNQALDDLLTHLSSLKQK